MTLLMLWRETMVGRVWMVSDSRLSARGQSGHVRFTDRAAKILEAEVVLRGPDRNGPPLMSRTLGFAYVGSSLIALQAHSAALPLWARLQSSAEQVLPTIGECADHLSRFVGAYAHEIAASGGDPQCQCILLGYDERHRAVEAWQITTVAQGSGITATASELCLAPGQLEAFGSGRSDALQQLNQLGVTGGWSREPLEMIRRQLRVDAPGTVGGGVQIGIATNEGFELCFDAQPFTAGISAAGDPLVAMRYRGFEFSEIGRVGHTFVTLRGIGR